MKSLAIFGIVFFLGLISRSHQQCPSWIPINETLYSQTFLTITDPNANTGRPLGFKTATYKFEGVRPCITVQSTDGNMRHIEIKWELEQAGRLCVSNNRNQQINCGTSRQFSICSTVPSAAASVQYSFFCQGDGCESGDKLFWYRFVVESPMENGMYDENWCDTRDDGYPGTLLQLPTNIIPPSQVTTPRGSSCSVTTNFMLLSATILVAVILH
uniref:Uncharacterized protein n=1 Tax=Ciona savignyi TaxID=51511 RepID=H2ZEJ7_CIOSA